MFKRIIGLMLVAAMLFSFPVFAEDTAATEVEAINEVVEDSGNVTFAKAMGIFTAEEVGTTPLTRGALARMFCAVTRYDITLAGAAKANFTDVSGETSAAVAEVDAMGVMTGVSDTMFMPDGHVTYAQALKAMVSFLGYKEYAEAKGGFPYGYYIQAQELGLIKNAPSNINVEITYEKIAELFKLALNVSYRRPYEYDEDVKKEIVKKLTYLEYHRDILRVNGLMDANSTLDLSGKGVTNRGQVKIDGILYTYDAEKFDASVLVGQNVDAYYNADTFEIIYAEGADTTIVVIDDNDLDGLYGNKLEYYTAEGKSKYLKVDAETSVVYNGKILPNYTDEDVNPFAETYMDGHVTAIDNDTDGVYDIIMVEAYETYVIDKLVDGIVYAKYRDGIAVDTRDVDLEANGLLVNIKGEPVKMNALKANNIVSVTRAADGEILEVVVTNDYYTGKLEGKKEIGGKLYLKIDGILFETSNALKLNTFFEDMTMGLKTQVMFNKEALISDFDQRTQNDYISGYLADYTVTEGMERAQYIRVFGADKQWYTIKIGEKISINDAPMAKVENFDVAVGLEGRRIKRQPIRYTLDEEGNLKRIYIANTTDRTAPFFMHEHYDGDPTFGGDSTGLYPRYYSRNLSGKMFIATNVIIYSVPAEADRDNEELYRIRTSGDSHIISSGSRNACEAYGDRDRLVANVLVYKGLEAKTTGDAVAVESGRALIVESAEEILDDEGNSAYRIVCVTGTKTIEYIDYDGKFLVAPGGTLPDKGDLIRVNVYETGGEVKAVLYYYDASEERIYYESTAASATAPADPSYVSTKWYDTSKYYLFAKGIVTYYDGEILEVTYKSATGAEFSYIYRLSGFRINKVVKRGKEVVIESAGANDIIGENQATGMGSKIVIETYKGATNKAIVIYED